MYIEQLSQHHLMTRKYLIADASVHLKRPPPDRPYNTTHEKNWEVEDEMRRYDMATNVLNK